MKKTILILASFISISLPAQKLPVFTVTKPDTSNSVQGYFFLTSADNSMLILDKEANIIYYKSVPTVLDYTLERGGTMVCATFYNSIYFMDSTFNTVDSAVCKNGVETNGHDRLLEPGGYLMLLGNEYVKEYLHKYPEVKKKTGSDTAFLTATVIQEQNAAGNVIWQWHAKDHFSIHDADDFYLKRDVFLQWTHSNSLELDEDGNILLSSRNLNEITKINRKDGSIMWRLGGKHNQFKFIDFSQPFYGQHNLRRLPNGHFTLIDNGQNYKSHGARAMEFELNEKDKTARLVWSYTLDKDIYSKGRGNVQRLANGNTLIDFGVVSKGDVCFVIVNPSGAKLLEVNGPVAYRVTNYSSLPFKLHRPEIKCFDSAGVKYLDAGKGYKTYQWSNGDTSRTIRAATANTSYSVFVPYGDGGFISSEKFIVGEIEQPCGIIPSSGGNKKTK